VASQARRAGGAKRRSGEALRLQNHMRLPWNVFLAASYAKAPPALFARAEVA